jgi:hypothetical protein
VRPTTPGTSRRPKNGSSRFRLQPCVSTLPQDAEVQWAESRLRASAGLLSQITPRKIVALVRNSAADTTTVAIAAVVVLVLAGSWWLLPGSTRKVATTSDNVGHLFVDSDPPGAQVEIDGFHVGPTPVAAVPIVPGRHLVRVGGATGREEEIEVKAGSEISRHFSLRQPETRTADAGRKAAASQSSAMALERPGERQSSRQRTTESSVPAALPAAPPGRGAPSARAPGENVAASSSALSPGSAGWAVVPLPFAVNVYEGTRLRGRSSDGPIRLASGSHRLTLTNNDLGYTENVLVQVTPGASATVRVQPPQRRVNINAIPWAEVFIDGQRTGETPIANLPIVIGTHEIVFRHPQYGEQRRTVTVTASASNVRVGVTFGK